MFKQNPDEDYIEPLEPRSNVNAFEELPLDLRLELQEERAFQIRCEKEQQAIEKVKQIAQERLEFNNILIQRMRGGSFTLQNYIDTFFNPSYLLKLNKKQKEDLLENTAEKFGLIINFVQNDAKIYSYILE
ncbi:MAG: hypothetical protein ACKOAD_04820, partial [Gammaproteobacteria bacterium]